MVRCVASCRRRAFTNLCTLSSATWGLLQTDFSVRLWTSRSYQNTHARKRLESTLCSWSHALLALLFLNTQAIVVEQT